MVHIGVSLGLLAIGLALGNVVANAIGSGELGAPAPSATSDATGGPTARIVTAPEDAARLLARLGSARAAALTARDTSALSRGVVPGSPLGNSDAAAIATLASNHRRYRGLTYVVRMARWVSEDGTHATIEGVVDTSAYEVTADSGTPGPVLHPGKPGLLLAYQLQRGADGS